MSAIRDMTKGDPAKHILLFSLPMLLGNVFQEMYSLVDTAVVGKVAGVTALAAVGAAGWLDWLVLSIVMGLTQGFAILISQRFGAGDIDGMKRAEAASFALSGISMAVITVVSVLLCPLVLTWMKTPEEAYAQSVSYIRVIFCGIPIITCYNLFSGLLRALGNSKTPLYAMIASSVTNVVLDLLFVAVFGWGVEGAAIATVIGQGVSTGICLVAMLRTPLLRITRKDFASIDRNTVKTLLRLGLPIAGQNAIVSVGGVIMQSIINSFGVIIVAGSNAALKVSGVLEMVGSSIGSSMHTFAGQNLGAKEYHRIRTGVRKALLISVSMAFVAGAAGILFGRQILSLFVDMSADYAQSVLDCAYDFLIVLSIALFSLHALFIFRSTLQGMGDAFFPVASSFLQVGMRTGVVYLLSLKFAEWGTYIGNVLAWVSACLFLMVVYIQKINRLDKKETLKNA